MFGMAGSTGSLGMGVVFSMKDEFSGAAERIGRNFNKLENITDAAMTRINASMNKMKLGIGILGAGAAVLAGMLFPTAKAMQFDEGMAKINTTAQLARPELNKLRDELMEFGVMPGVTADIDKIPESYEKIISQTGEVALSSDIMKTALKGATAGFTEVDTVAGALAQTLSIVGKQNATAQEVMDTLFAAKRVGAGEFADFANYLPTLIAAGANLRMNYKEVSGLFAYMTGKGQDASSSAMLLQNAFAALGKPEITQGLAKAGVAVFDAGGKLRGTADIFKDLNKVMGSMSTSQQADFLYKVGLRDVQAKNAFAILASDVGKLDEAIKATSDPTGELADALENGKTPLQTWKELQNQISYGLLKLGTSLLPMVNTAMGFLKGMIHGVVVVFTALTNNPVGRFLMGLVGILAGLAVVLGIVIFLVNLKAFVAAKASLAFANLKMQTIALAFAEKGLTAGLYEMAVAAWTAMAPFLPFILIAAAVAAVVWFLWKSVKSFNEVLDGTAKPATGFLGFMQKVGGVISGVAAIFSSWNSDTGQFELGQKMHDTLQKMGILELVLNIGTWVGRIKSFLSGMWQAFKEVFHAIREVVHVVGSAIRSGLHAAGKVLEGFGIHVGKNTSDIHGWMKAGKIVGYIIMAFLIPIVISLTASMISLAVAVISATWPILLIIGIIWGIYYAITHWGQITDWIKMKWHQAVEWIGNKLGQLGDWFMGLPKKAFSMGVNFVRALKDGIASLWDDLKGWVSEKLYYLNPANWGEGLGKLWDWAAGGTEGEMNAENVGSKNQATEKIAPTMAAVNQAGRQQGANTSKVVNNTVALSDVHTEVKLDGEVIAKNVTKRHQLENARK